MQACCKLLTVICLPSKLVFALRILKQMTLIDPRLPTAELLKLAAQNHRKAIILDESDRQILTALLKERGQDELDYGQELEVDNVRLVKRVNGAVGIYYS